MKETPMLFSDPMVRAILSGQKTQTRRVVKHKWPHLWQEPWYATGRVLNDLPNQPGAFMEFRHRSQDAEGYTGSPASTLVPCPYGQPGDRLWVREAWRVHKDANHLPPRDLPQALTVRYEADGLRDSECGKYRPPMFMPRWACRLVLEIVSVRVERLQDISEADARAEGVDDRMILNAVQQTPNPLPPSPYVGGFRWLWESINGAESWAANPWVWVVEFRRVQK